MKRKFNYNKEYKLGEVIYPIDNGTSKRWAVVTKIKKGLSYKMIKWFDCIECAELYSILIKNRIINYKMIYEKTTQSKSKAKKK